MLRTSLIETIRKVLMPKSRIKHFIGYKGDKLKRLRFYLESGDAEPFEHLEIARSWIDGMRASANRGEEYIAVILKFLQEHSTIKRPPSQDPKPDKYLH